MRTQYKFFSKLFRAAGNDTRSSILSMLMRGPMDLGTILRHHKQSPSLVAHHLNVLRDAGWVTKSKFGRLVTYYLNEKTVHEVISFLKKS